MDIDLTDVENWPDYDCFICGNNLPHTHEEQNL